MGINAHVFMTSQVDRKSCFSLLGMVKRCVAGGCGNTNREGVSLFIFPKDLRMRRRWANQVKRTRKGWEGPTYYSVLCSLHFEAKCFEAASGLYKSFGLGRRRPQLKSDAVPTLFERPVLKRSRSAAKEGQITTKRRTALKQRERTAVSPCCVGVGARVTGIRWGNP